MTLNPGTARKPADRPNPVFPHDPGHTMLSNNMTPIAKVLENAWTSISSPALFKTPPNVRKQFPIHLAAAAFSAFQPAVVASRLDLQRFAHPSDRYGPAMAMDLDVPHCGSLAKYVDTFFRN